MKDEALGSSPTFVWANSLFPFGWLLHWLLKRQHISSSEDLLNHLSPYAASSHQSLSVLQGLDYVLSSPLSVFWPMKPTRNLCFWVSANTHNEPDSKCHLWYPANFAFCIPICRNGILIPSPLSYGHSHWGQQAPTHPIHPYTTLRALGTAHIPLCFFIAIL